MSGRRPGSGRAHLRRLLVGTGHLAAHVGGTAGRSDAAHAQSRRGVPCAVRGRHPGFGLRTAADADPVSQRHPDRAHPLLALPAWCRTSCRARAGSRCRGSDTWGRLRSPTRSTRSSACSWIRSSATPGPAAGRAGTGRVGSSDEPRNRNMLLKNFASARAHRAARPLGGRGRGHPVQHERRKEARRIPAQRQHGVHPGERPYQLRSSLQVTLRHGQPISPSLSSCLGPPFGRPFSLPPSALMRERDDRGPHIHQNDRPADRSQAEG